MKLAIILTIAVLAILVVVFMPKKKKQEYIGKRQATDRINPELTVRLTNINKNSHLYLAGLRNGKFASIIQGTHKVFVKTKLKKLKDASDYCCPLWHKDSVYIQIHTNNFKVLK